MISGSGSSCSVLFGKKSDRGCYCFLSLGRSRKKISCSMSIVVVPEGMIREWSQVGVSFSAAVFSLFICSVFSAPCGMFCLGPPDRPDPSLHWSPATFILKTRCCSFSFIIILGKTSWFSVIFYGDFAQQNDYDVPQLLTFNFLGRQI